MISYRFISVCLIAALPALGQGTAAKTETSKPPLTEAARKLTPEQRRIARENYKTIKKLPPDKRQQVKAQWQEYQQSLAAKPEAVETPAAAPTSQQ